MGAGNAAACPKMSISRNGGFPKMVGFPNKPMGFPTKNDQHLEWRLGVPPFWGKHPNGESKKALIIISSINFCGNFFFDKKYVCQELRSVAELVCLWSSTLSVFPLQVPRKTIPPKKSHPDVCRSTVSLTDSDFGLSGWQLEAPGKARVEKKCCWKWGEVDGVKMICCIS